MGASGGTPVAGLPHRRESARPVFAGAATALSGALLAGEADDEQVQQLISETATATHLDREAAASCLHSLAMRDHTLLAAEPTEALHAQLAGFLLFAGAVHASLWLVERGEDRCLARVGRTVANRRLAAAARAAIADTRRQERSDLRAMPVSLHGVNRAALVVRLGPRGIRKGLAFAAETALALSVVLERRLLLERTFSAGEQLLDAAERHIARMGFDIHDGPLQGLAVVAGELTMLGRQFETIGNGELEASARRRLSDLRALVLDLGMSLRAIASTAAPGKLDLRAIFEQEVARLERGTGMQVDLEIAGDLEATTASQRIALARVVEEAFANIREHSGATCVQVSVRRESGSLRLHVADNGRGFDVARARRRAGRDLRLGLTAMEQRVRLLGGQLEVASRPGGPTVISASLPAWSPLPATARL